MAQKVETIPAKVGNTRIATQHKRLTISTAVTLAAAWGSALPTIPGNNVGELKYPTTVWLQVEAGGGPVYYTVDGQTPTAALGMQIPGAPAQIALPYPDLLRNSGTVSATNQQIQLFAPASTNVQALLEYV